MMKINVYTVSMETRNSSDHSLALKSYFIYCTLLYQPITKMLYDDYIGVPIMTEMIFSPFTQV
jgi:hypothetical protein